jgi:hypothetical protein
MSLQAAFAPRSQHQMGKSMGLFKSRQPEPLQVNGKDLRCLICGHDQFWKRNAQLNTAAATFFNLDWANRSAVCVICDSCGYIHWFLPS